jgi:hypothetical protein
LGEKTDILDYWTDKNYDKLSYLKKWLNIG